MTDEISSLKAKLASSAITVNSTFISNTNINNTVINNSFFETIINSTNETNVFITNIIKSGNVEKIREALINQVRLLLFMQYISSSSGCHRMIEENSGREFANVPLIPRIFP